MGLRIKALFRNPFGFSLVEGDHPCALFIRSSSGTILIDEPMSASLDPKKGPVFSVDRVHSDKIDLILYYRGVVFTWDATDHRMEIDSWANDANEFLTTKQFLPTEQKLSH